MRFCNKPSFLPLLTLIFLFSSPGADPEHCLVPVSWSWTSLNPGQNRHHLSVLRMGFWNLPSSPGLGQPGQRGPIGAPTAGLYPLAGVRGCIYQRQNLFSPLKKISQQQPRFWENQELPKDPLYLPGQTEVLFFTGSHTPVPCGLEMYSDPGWTVLPPEKLVPNCLGGGGGSIEILQGPRWALKWSGGFEANLE